MKILLLIEIPTFFLQLDLGLFQGLLVILFASKQTRVLLSPPESLSVPSSFQ